jgi:branched-subunit amino acid transport protein
MLELLALLLAGVVTFIERAFFLVSKRVRPPKRVLRYLPLVGPAVLGAIAVPGILAPRGAVTLIDTVPAVLAAIIATLLWRWTKQLVIALVVALAAWWGMVFALVQLGLR